MKCKRKRETHTYAQRGEKTTTAPEIFIAARAPGKMQYMQGFASAEVYEYLRVVMAPKGRML